MWIPVPHLLVVWYLTSYLGLSLRFSIFKMEKIIAPMSDRYCLLSLSNSYSSSYSIIRSLNLTRDKTSFSHLPLQPETAMWSFGQWDVSRSCSMCKFLLDGSKYDGFSWCTNLEPWGNFRNGSRAQLSNQIKASVSDSMKCYSSPGSLSQES